MMGLIIDKKATENLYKEFKKRIDLKLFLSAWKKIDPTDNIENEEKAVGKEFLFTEHELLEFLVFTDFISKALSGKYFIYFKNVLPEWEDKMDEIAEEELTDKELREHLTIEKTADFYSDVTNMFIRLAFLKLHKNTFFCNRLEQRLNYEL